MAKAAWCTVAPTTGENNKPITITATAHTGRTIRSTTVTVQNKNGTKPSKSIAVTQAAKELFITKISGVTPDSIPSSGAVVAITGKSNAKTIAIIEGEADAMHKHEFKVNGVLQVDSNGDSTTPIFIIDGDPGASGEYTFDSKITVPENPFPWQRTLIFEFMGYLTNGNTENPVSFTASLTQAGIASTLAVNKDSVSLVNTGTAQIVEVVSNDHWTVS